MTEPKCNYDLTCHAAICTDCEHANAADAVIDSQAREIDQLISRVLHLEGENMRLKAEQQNTRNYFNVHDDIVWNMIIKWRGDL
jgi:hypothetical protein